jgi:SAM-dependent methyltransferase
LAISDGRTLRVTDYETPASEVAEYLKNDGAFKVLELGAGRASNSQFLAKKFPNADFTALDLPKRGFLKNKVQPNVKLVEGDYHKLPSEWTRRFDVVFAVETVCYSADKKRVYDEMLRVLKDGGVAVVFDGYDAKRRRGMSILERKTMKTIWSSMVVPNGHMSLSETEEALKKSHVEYQVRKQNVSPCLLRLEKFGKLFFEDKIVGLLRFIVPKTVTYNAIAAYLWRPAYDAGWWGYYEIVARKRNAKSNIS